MALSGIESRTAIGRECLVDVHIPSIRQSALAPTGSIRVTELRMNNQERFASAREKMSYLLRLTMFASIFLYPSFGFCVVQEIPSTTTPGTQQQVQQNPN